MTKQISVSYFVVVDGKNVSAKKKFGNRKAASAAFDKAVKRSPRSLISLMSKHPRHGVTQLRVHGPAR